MHPNDTTTPLMIDGRRAVERACLHCGTRFIVRESAVKRGHGQHCSRACRHAARTTHEGRTCRTCGAKFTVAACRIRRGDGLYCSDGCARAGRRAGEQRHCRQCGRLFYAAPSAIKKGQGQCCSRLCHSKAQRSPLLTERPCAQCGKMYRPRQTTSRYCSIPCRALAKRQAGRNGGWARAWRLAVFRRDAFTCRDCGQRGGELHAHHVVAWAADPARRFDVANGVTLCLACHQRHHPWMRPHRR